MSAIPSVPRRTRLPLPTRLPEVGETGKEESKPVEVFSPATPLDATEEKKTPLPLSPAPKQVTFESPVGGKMDSLPSVEKKNDDENNTEAADSDVDSNADPEFDDQPEPMAPMLSPELPIPAAARPILPLVFGTPSSMAPPAALVGSAPPLSTTVTPSRFAVTGRTSPIQAPALPAGLAAPTQSLPTTLMAPLQPAHPAPTLQMPHLVPAMVPAPANPLYQAHPILTNPFLGMVRMASGHMICEKYYTENKELCDEQARQYLEANGGVLFNPVLTASH